MSAGMKPDGVTFGTGLPWLSTTSWRMALHAALPWVGAAQMWELRTLAALVAWAAVAAPKLAVSVPMATPAITRRRNKRTPRTVDDLSPPTGGDRGGTIASGLAQERHHMVRVR